MGARRNAGTRHARRIRTSIEQIWILCWRQRVNVVVRNTENSAPVSIICGMKIERKRKETCSASGCGRQIEVWKSKAAPDPGRYVHTNQLLRTNENQAGRFAECYVIYSTTVTAG